MKHRESLMSKVNDDNKHHFVIKWKEQYGDIAEISLKITHLLMIQTMKMVLIIPV